jgi:hypothetical protein
VLSPVSVLPIKSRFVLLIKSVVRKALRMPANCLWVNYWWSLW